mmetsp:Transcript_49714/g.74103  ORF Transcript_49714/g.74103 Transcript_49714/m.74103 type:complete len:348 (-) Transcript_49714:1228-2271(-)
MESDTKGDDEEGAKPPARKPVSDTLLSKSKDGETGNTVGANDETSSASALGAKRPASASGSEGVGATARPPKQGKLSKSERKKEKEKQRRRDINQALEDLHRILVEVDPESRHRAEREQATRQVVMMTEPRVAGNEAAFDRVELIQRAANVISRLQQENHQLKTSIQQLMQVAQHSSTMMRLGLRSSFPVGLQNTTNPSATATSVDASQISAYTLSMQPMGVFPQLGGVVGWTTSSQQQQTGALSTATGEIAASTRQQEQPQPISAALQQQLLQLQQAAQQQQMLANAAQSVATASASTPITLSVSSVNNSGLVVGQAGLNNTQTQQDEAAQSTREDRPGADDNTFE